MFREQFLKLWSCRYTLGFYKLIRINIGTIDQSNLKKQLTRHCYSNANNQKDFQPIVSNHSLRFFVPNLVTSNTNLRNMAYNMYCLLNLSSVLVLFANQAIYASFSPIKCKDSFLIVPTIANSTSKIIYDQIRLLKPPSSFFN